MAMPREKLAAVAEAEFSDLERVWGQLDLPGHQVELIDGEIVVSPTASRRHSVAIDRLIKQLFNTTLQHSWDFHTNFTVHVPATRERLIPDLMVASADAPGFGDNELLAPGALLVAEVVSPSTRRRDRVTKARAYAQGGIPLYLIIDHFAEPPVVILLSQPGEHGYAQTEAAQAGEPLELPEPFSLSLDTKLLLP